MSVFPTQAAGLYSRSVTIQMLQQRIIDLFSIGPVLHSLNIHTQVPLVPVGWCSCGWIFPS